jgi:hypothetical protein
MSPFGLQIRDSASVTLLNWIGERLSGAQPVEPGDGAIGLQDRRTAHGVEVSTTNVARNAGARAAVAGRRRHHREQITSAPLLHGTGSPSAPSPASPPPAKSRSAGVAVDQRDADGYHPLVTLTGW